MEPEKNNLASWFSNFVSWQGTTNAHILSSVIEERRRQRAKRQTKWVSYFFPAPMLRVWLISAISCLLTSAWYCYHYSTVAPHAAHQPQPTSKKIIAALPPPTVKITPQHASLPVRAHANQKLYRQWLGRGIAAEKRGKLTQAARCYSWALVYHNDLQLQQRLRVLDQRLQQQRRKVVEHSLAWENALQLERTEKYRQALKLYEKLARTATVAGPWQTKIDYCRTIIHLEQQLTTLTQKIDTLLTAGSWSGALHLYQKFFCHCRSQSCYYQ